MKSFKYSLIFISSLTIIWIILFQLSTCYPEHGSDGIGFCSNSKIVSFLWVNNKYIGLLLVFLGLLSVILQGYSLYKLMKNHRIKSSYILSSTIPLIYGSLIIGLALYRDITNSTAELSSKGMIILTAITIILGQLINITLVLHKKLIKDHVDTQF